MGSADTDQFCLRWNDFQQCIKSTFQGLRDEKDFMDVTVSCDGEQVKAHKAVLSACSDTFRNLLKKNPARYPVIVLWGVLPRDLTSILNFMYNGEVNVKQDHLNSFLAVAKRLRVRGLCQTRGSSKSRISNQISRPFSTSPSSFTESSSKRSQVSHYEKAKFGDTVKFSLWDQLQRSHRPDHTNQQHRGGDHVAEARACLFGRGV